MGSLGDEADRITVAQLKLRRPARPPAHTSHTRRETGDTITTAPGGERPIRRPQAAIGPVAGGLTPQRAGDVWDGADEEPRTQGQECPARRGAPPRRGRQLLIPLRPPRLTVSAPPQLVGKGD